MVPKELQAPAFITPPENVKYNFLTEKDIVEKVVNPEADQSLELELKIELPEIFDPDSP